MNMNKKPFICMNLTQEEWDRLDNLYGEDYEAADDLYIDIDEPKPLEREKFLMMITKPSWA